ncbi:hypothetical protein [Onishia taeanensis]
MVNKKKFLIFAPSYRENSGGIVVLHKLCDLLNGMGYESYICPQFENFEVNAKNFPRRITGFFLSQVKRKVKKFQTNKNFNTPLLDGVKKKNLDDFIVVYPEITSGNPLNAKNVVRWLLHQPGFHSGKVNYGRGELYFKFNSAIKDFCIEGSKLSENDLKVIHYPLDTYYPPKDSGKRCGTAYCIRKGKGKEIQHDLSESVLIDDKSSREVAEIFRNVKTFISYDTYTAYSIFAVICGAESVVVPDYDVDIDEWYPDLEDRNGIAYGFSPEELDRARNTKHLVLDHVKNEELKSAERVRVCAQEAQDFFLSREAQK